MKNIDTLAYFLEEGTLKGILRDWPAGMSLVMCMDEAGKCELVVFHEKEAERILSRVAAVLGKPAGSFSVVPQVQGYPTRKVLFSEEQKLLALVADSDHLGEIASDYAINFTFAHEEGLDPEALMAVRRAPNDRTGAGKADDAVRGGAKAATLSRAAPAAKAPAFRHSSSVPLLGLSADYVRMSDAEKQDCHFLEGLLDTEGAAIRLTIRPDAMGEDPAPQAVPGIAFRDDFSRFVLPRASLGPRWRPGTAARFVIPASEFPAPLAERFRSGPHRAQVTITRGGIFVAPGARVEPEQAATPAPSPKRVDRRRLRLPHLFLFAGLTVIGLVSGTVFGALQGV